PDARTTLDLPSSPTRRSSDLPMTKLDSSDARKSAADATSSGCPSSDVSWRLRIWFRPSSRFGYDSRRYFSTNGVWIVPGRRAFRSEEHTSELQSLRHLVCRLL